MQSQQMDRGTDALKSQMSGTEAMEIRQTRKGWCQEILGCEAKTEFKYFIDGEERFHSLEETDRFCRMCCQPIHPFKTSVKELNSEEEIMALDRPCACCAFPCKCCSYQTASFTSGSDDLGRIEETYYYCIPTFNIFDQENNHRYVVHQPTCCAGTCVNCCAEGNPCGKGCCKVSFRFYEPGQPTDGDAPYLGTILKKPKSLKTEVFTDANAFDVTFPKNATAAVKGIFIGTSVFLNAIFFEGED